MPKRKYRGVVEEKDNSEDGLKIDGIPLKSACVYDLRKELEKIGLSTLGKKPELVDRLFNHFKQPNPFDSLPVEIVLKILKMAAARTSKSNDKSRYNHSYIMNTIGRVSTGFQGGNSICRLGPAFGCFCGLFWRQCSGSHLIEDF